MLAALHRRGIALHSAADARVTYAIPTFDTDALLMRPD